MLDVKGVSLSYGRTAVISDLTLTGFEPGELVGILGANGVGKSTFLRAVAGMGRYSGRISMKGEDLRALSAPERAASIGYVPQTAPQSSNFVAYEFVISACRSAVPDLSRDVLEERTEQVFQTLGLQDLAFRRLNRMSGGQRQLVGLSQILVRDPDLMLLDEPSTGLDLRWQIVVFDLFRARLRERGGLCLAALHDMNLALRHCDRLAVLADGGLIAFGAPAEVMTPDVLRRAFGVEGRIEVGSQGTPIAVIDSAGDALSKFGKEWRP